MSAVVAVIGGGYGGTLVAEGLDDVAGVVLVDPREAFVNVAASLRALTQPAWARNAFFPYDSLLAHGRHVQDRATSVDPAGVVLAGGDRVDADFIVLATGSSYPYPAHPRHGRSSIAGALADLRQTHAELAAAGRVLIVGAGPVGLELAGEIREVWPDKGVTVVGRGKELLSGYLPAVRDELTRQLTALGVDVRLGTGLTGLPATAAGTLAPFVVTTDAGEEIGADVWFAGFGSRPSTGYLDEGRLVRLTPAGLVPVTNRLSVVGHENVYALGDITDVSEPKMATWAQTQAGVVVENVRAQLDGRVPSSVYTPATTADLRIFLPLGPWGGVGQVPGPDGAAIPAPIEVVRERKGRDLFTARFAQRFHQS